MQVAPRYDDVVADVREFLSDRIEAAIGAGIPRERIWIDPGIGFGKTFDHNLALLRGLDDSRPGTRRPRRRLPRPSSARSPAAT